jgi:hypothetical protein
MILPSGPFSLPSRCPPLCISHLDQTQARISRIQALVPSFVSTYYYFLIRVSTIKVLLNYIDYLSLIWLLLREGLQPSFMLQSQLRALQVLFLLTSKIDQPAVLSSKINNFDQLVLIFTMVPVGWTPSQRASLLLSFILGRLPAVHLFVYVCYLCFWDDCMPRNLPVSNKRDLKENSCVSLGASYLE